MKVMLTMLNAHKYLNLLLTLASLLCFVLFWSVGAWLNIPLMRGNADSLLMTASPLLSVVATWIALGIAALFATLITGKSRRAAGLCAACFGLTALSLRGGTIRSILMAHPTPSVYLMLIGESILLLVGLIGASFVSQKLLNLMGNKMNPSTGPAAHERHPWTLTITSIVCQIVLMALLMPLLVKDPLKIQALVGVFVSAGVATALSGTFFHRPPLAAWICVGPMLVAIIGYALAWSNPGLISIGLTSQPLAGAIPLDYASVGSAGAIIGSWYSAKHKLNWLDIIVSRVSGQPMPQAIERA